MAILKSQIEQTPVVGTNETVATSKPLAKVPEFLEVNLADDPDDKADLAELWEHFAAVKVLKERVQGRRITAMQADPAYMNTVRSKGFIAAWKPADVAGVDAAGNLRTDFKQVWGYRGGIVTVKGIADTDTRRKAGPKLDKGVTFKRA